MGEAMHMRSPIVASTGPDENSSTPTPPNARSAEQNVLRLSRLAAIELKEATSDLPLGS